MKISGVTEATGKEHITQNQNIYWQDAFTVFQRIALLKNFTEFKWNNRDWVLSHTRRVSLEIFPYKSAILSQELFNYSRPILSESCIKIKINLSFCFHNSLWCLKKFYEGLEGLHKTFLGTTLKCKNKSLSEFSRFARDRGGKG